VPVDADDSRRILPIEGVVPVVAFVIGNGNQCDYRRARDRHLCEGDAADQAELKGMAHETVLVGQCNEVSANLDASFRGDFFAYSSSASQRERLS
jgi:hypothetical protein